MLSFEYTFGKVQKEVFIEKILEKPKICQW